MSQWNATEGERKQNSMQNGGLDDPSGHDGGTFKPSAQGQIKESYTVNEICK